MNKVQRPRRDGEALLTEVADRTRRMETRLTKFLQVQGFDVQSTKPRFDAVAGMLHVPSLASSIADCLNAIPPSWDQEVEIEVVHKGTVAVSLFLAK